MKKNKYSVKKLDGSSVVDLEVEYLVSNEFGIVAFNTTKTEPRTQEVIFATKSTDLYVIKID